MQYYGLTGRKIKPNYVGVVNAGARNLPAQKAVKDEEDYRAKTLADEEAYRAKTLAGEDAYRTKGLADTEAYRTKGLADTEAYRTKELTDTEAYRNKSFALEADRMAQEEKFARETLKAQEKDAEKANYIGLGQLGISAYQGRQRDNALKDVITGGGSSGKTSGSVAPTISGDVGGSVKASGSIPPTVSWDSLASKQASFDAEQNSLSPDSGGSMGLGTSSGSGIWEGIKGGASNWGDIALGAGVGATVGSKLGEKYIDDTDLGRAAGAALTSGALSYLSSGNLYTSAISAIFGGALGALF